MSKKRFRKLREIKEQIQEDPEVLKPVDRPTEIDDDSLLYNFNDIDNDPLDQGTQIY